MRLHSMVEDKSITPEQSRVKPWFAIDGDKNLRLDYELDKNSVVYDVGGYLGEWANPINTKFHCCIEIFEPVDKFADVIEKKFKTEPKIHIHRFGLAGKTKNIAVSLEDASSSTFKASGSDKKELIKLVAAKEFIPTDLKKIDLIKINIEGGEYELLNHLIDTGLIKIIQDIQVQFHNFVPDAHEKRSLLHKKLSQTHYLTYSYPWIWENWRIMQ
jgi:FkbM family methyltransferase